MKTLNDLLNYVRQNLVSTWLGLGGLVLTYFGVLEAFTIYPSQTSLFFAVGMVIVGAERMHKPIPPADKGS